MSDLGVRCSVLFVNTTSINKRPQTDWHTCRKKQDPHTLSHIVYTTYSTHSMLTQTIQYAHTICIQRQLNTEFFPLRAYGFKQKQSLVCASVLMLDIFYSYALQCLLVFMHSPLSWVHCTGGDWGEPFRFLAPLFFLFILVSLCEPCPFILALLELLYLCSLKEMFYYY